jgi:hypothetical protein
MVKVVRLKPEPDGQKFEGRYLDCPDDWIIGRDSLGVLSNGDLKFLYLRNQFELQSCAMVYERLRHLRYSPASHSRRAALRGSGGGDLYLGWTKDTNASGKPRRTLATEWYPFEVGFVIWPLLAAASLAMKNHLPDVWKDHVERAGKNGSRLIGGGLRDLVGQDGVWIVGANGKRRKIRASDITLPIFSTVTINRNTTCRSHVDARNARGLSCMTTFGQFTGGALCFPRLKVAFDVRPGDLLIADTNREQHGNVGGRVGDRISVVGYLRDMSAKCSLPAFGKKR